MVENIKRIIYNIQVSVSINSFIGTQPFSFVFILWIVSLTLQQSWVFVTEIARPEDYYIYFLVFIERVCQAIL